ncbi:MFS transporter [Lapillicoccus jejuensis]|uniref:Putative MFS family arabinose efflux permease n=1 Tax=Lapillicoccus jejuensis TaxID=402171 RepID=A0A542E415_9MICO|nr:MFS transporter [Lapillicoccus jejuensis]TQJ10088.1 putative MFS family arabinose efflux permease [Lapillicoccus jejuensis]
MSTASVVSTLPLRADRDFRRYWWARVVSVTGTVVTTVALPVLVYRLTGSPGLTALTTTLEALPYLLVGLVAGAVADRVDRRRLMVAADLVNVVVVGSVPLAWFLGHLTVPHVLVTAFLVQTVFTFYDGANFGALPVLVGTARVADANAAVWSVGGVVDLVGPAAAGAVLAVLHPAELLVVDAASYAVSAVLVARIGRPLSRTRERRGGRAAVVGEVREGLGFLWRHTGVRTLTFMGTLQSAAGGGFMALFVPWSDRVLGIGTSGWRFGLVYSVWGIGGVAAATASARLQRRLGATRVCLLAMPLSAAAGIAATLTRSWVVAALVLVAWGVAYQLVLVASITYRQTVTPEHLLSRVNTTARMLAWGVGWSLGAVAAGALAGGLGVQRTMLVLACASVLAALLGWLSPLRSGDPHDRAERAGRADGSPDDHLVGAPDGSPRGAESMDA